MIDSGWFVLAPEVDAFETEFAAVSGAPHAVSTGNGTDALAIALRALDIGPGDEVITVPNTFIASAAAITAVGATPVFVDVDPATHQLDPTWLPAAINFATRSGPVSG